mmetsp:Transcript_6691/g.15281  ORF Transcript_6691/g.15281 Transcript_6691/m.15281 type:complete len:479 (-) Transcript_6691:804-2240(-)
MCENLNAEIAIGTIKSVVDAVGYLKWTFFARRVKGNPSYYGAASSSDEDVEIFLVDVVQKALRKLKEYGCIEIEEGGQDNRAVTPTILGRTASNYYLQHSTPHQMLAGVVKTRKVVSAALAEEKKVAPPKGELTALDRTTRIDEISLASLLYAISDTPEFDELPVRHNEEHLNAELSSNLMWGPDTSTVLDPQQGNSSYIDLDVMADPHTKCFLLLQAYLERAKLPISDYINDTMTVITQIPRLLAAMQYLALENRTIADNFELLTQFSRVRQLVSTRSMIDSDPLSRLDGFTNDVIRRMKNGAKSNKKDTPTLWQLRRMGRDKSASLIRSLLKGKADIDRMLDSVYSIPVFSVEDLRVSKSTKPGSTEAIGKLEVDLSIGYESTGGHKKKDEDPPLTLAILLGSAKRRNLLAHSTVGISRHGDSSSPTKKKAVLEFDWEPAANDTGDGGADNVSFVVRFLVEEIRGLDGEFCVGYGH